MSDISAKFKPNLIIRGPILLGPVRIIVALPLRESTKLIGKGLIIGQAHEPVLNTEQLAKLKVTPEEEPLDGDPNHFRLGVEALGLSLIPGLILLEDNRPITTRLIDEGFTRLDRLHQAMLHFARYYSALLRPFLIETQMGTNPRFWQLAQTLSILYPANSYEKLWVDGVLARKKVLGF